MDSLIAAAARALSLGDPLAALQRVALRNDPPALALRGIAMAQLDDLPRARELLRRAARAFGGHEATARARCVVAEAEVALAMRDLGAQPRSLVSAVTWLTAQGDAANAGQGLLIIARRALLLGRLLEAQDALARARALQLPPLPTAVAELTAAELALRRLQTGEARASLAGAQAAAERAGVRALQAEVAELASTLDRPAARRWRADGEEVLRLGGVQALFDADVLVVDACRRGVGRGGEWLSLARRPVLFTLAQGLAQAWPGDADRNALIERAFRTRRPDETHRARLRVEIGRLRRLLTPLARIEATARGFALRTEGQDVAVLAPPIDGEQAALQALLSDGQAWSTSALALAVGESQRTVQRALADLEAAGRVRALGQARARRWLAPPLTGFTTILLLPAALALD